MDRIVPGGSGICNRLRSRYNWRGAMGCAKGWRGRAHIMIRAVLFDFDGMLVEVPRHRYATRQALFDAGAARVYALLASRGCKLPTFARFLKRQKRIARRMAWHARLTRGEPDGRRFLRQLCHDYALQRDDTALGTLGWLWHQPQAETTILPDGVLPTLQSLRASGLRLGLVVNTPLLGRIVDQHLATLGLLDLFPARAYSSDIGARKPDARLYRAALEELHIEPAQCAFVSSAWKPDLLGARALGMTTILQAPAGRAPRQARPEHSIQRLDQLPPLLEHQINWSSPPKPSISCV